jgi:hypothetical protein
MIPLPYGRFAKRGDLYDDVIAYISFNIKLPLADVNDGFVC